ncbi:VOC family protein [bacterium]|nr:VOC family protein [bacterium]
MNNICYFELPAQNLGKTTAFYEKLFAWKHGSSGAEYAMVNPPSGIQGGLGKETKTAVLYIEVEDITATLKEIEAAGGATVLPETKIETDDGEDFGKFGLFKDPEGTLMGLWSK